MKNLNANKKHSSSNTEKPQMINEKIKSLILQLNKDLIEREETIKLSLLSLISGENMIIFGPPGTAKSEISRRLSEVLKNHNYFEYLLTKFSTPEEIFGPLSIQSLKNDIYLRKTEGYIPDANIVFLDEIFKSNSSILNSLLTILNEKIYHNGGIKMKTPLISLISASNELPFENQELTALYDRFLVRNIVDSVSKNRFFELLQSDSSFSGIEDTLKFTLEEIETIKNNSNEIIVYSRILETIERVSLELKKYFKDDPIENISDRRYKKIIKVLKVSAYTNGRKYVNYSDLYLMIDMLWNKPENRLKIKEIVEKTVKEFAFEFNLEKNIELWNAGKNLKSKKLEKIVEGNYFFISYTDEEKIELIKKNIWLGA